MKKRKIFLGLAIAGAAIFGLAACNETPAASSSGTQEVQQYTVTFKDAGTTVSTATVDSGSKVTKPADPTKAEDAFATYVFAGWFTDEAMTTEFDFNSTIEASTTLFAKYYAVSKETRIMMNGTAYETITAALAAIPTDSTETFTISLPKGTYTENGLGYNGSATVVIKGNTATKYGADVIIKGHGSDMSTEKTRNLIEIQGTGNIILENLTLESDWTREAAGGNNAQAEVLGTDTKGNTVAYNCGFKSHQDTLRTAGKAWFYGCYIEGDVDFIWMERAGSVALYENCEIVSVYDATAKTHASYVAAPRMDKTSKVGKGLVVYNSEIKETAEAKENGQLTYLCRNPWSSETTYYNQVAYINTKCENVIEEQVYYNKPTETDFVKTAIGYKMDQATANSLGYSGDGDILDATTTKNEFGGREAIINRVFNTGKLRYEKDSANYWDLKQLIELNHWTVKKDTSKSVLDGESTSEPTVYKFDGSVDQSSLCDGFAVQEGKTHYVGKDGATITIPVTGKSYVEVYGYYAGTVEAKANSQGEQVMFFNNGTTSSEVENDYIVYDAAATSVVITAKDTTYITKIVVVKDTSIADAKVTGIEVTGSTTKYCVGVPLKLTAKATPGTAINKSVKWSSSNETVATINAYTGKVTFLTAGQVTFTATATDGSGVTGTFSCEPTVPEWSIAEWYTTDNDVKVEDGAQEIGAFDTASSAYKGLNKEYTFTNAAGQTIKTSKGLKFNSAGKLVISTTKANAVVTLTTVDAVNTKATPKVFDGEGNAASLLDTKANADGTTTYVYSLATAGVWTITRGNDNAECNPVLYASCEYINVISTATDLLFGTNGNYETADAFKITAQVADNGGNNSQVKNGNIVFTVAAGAKVEVYANWGEAYIINGDDGTAIEHDGTSVGNAGQRFYEYTKQTKVIIQCDPNATGHNYFYWIKVTFPTA